MKLIDFIKNPNTHDNKIKLLIYFQLVVAMTGISGFILHQFTKCHQQANLLWIAIAVVNILLAELTLRTKHRKFFLYLTLYFYVFVFLPGGLIIASPMHSASILYVLLVLFIVAMLSVKLTRIVLSASLIFITILIAYISNEYPDLLPKESENYLLDWVVNIITIFSLSSIIISSLANQYHRENKKKIVEIDSLKINSETDFLTKIPNRQKLFSDLSQINYEIGNTSIIMLDLDYFKRYNDKYGHVQGDECLKQIANSLRKINDDNIVNVYRYGGEEFIFLIDGDKTIAHSVAVKIQKTINKLKIENNQSTVSEKLTSSFGISEINNFYNITEAINSADTALYQAKSNGRDNIVVI